MQSDLNEQFQRAQAVTSNEGMPKWIIALIVGLILSLGLVIVMGTVFIVKMLDKVVAAPSDTESGYSEEYNTEESPIDLFGASGTGDTATGEATTNRFQNSSNSKDVSANFKFGTVSGTSYYSEFSGISFKAPAGWTLSSYSNSSYVNLLSPKDMSASSDDLSETVTISYKTMKSHFYEDIREALSTQIKLANSGANNTMIDDNVSASLGGNEFTGILYKKSSDFYTYYIQVMVAEVNGYALEIYIEADTQEELQGVLAMFS